MRKPLYLASCLGILVWIYVGGGIIAAFHLAFRLGRAAALSSAARWFVRLIGFAFQMAGAICSVIVAFQVSNGYSVVFAGLFLVIFVIAVNSLLYHSGPLTPKAWIVSALTMAISAILVAAEGIRLHLLYWRLDSLAGLVGFVALVIVASAILLAVIPESRRDPGVEYAPLR